MPAGSNYRIYYPLNYIAIGPHASASGIPVHGTQSVSTTTSFNLEQVFELGQLEIYENIENLPAVELTAEKVLDGYPLIYHLATTDATNAGLLSRSNQRCDIILSLFSDDFENASGVPLVQAYCSGMYVDNVNYNLVVQGNATESVTFVGNDKLWVTASGQVWHGKTGFAFEGHFDGNDSPASGVQRRQDVKMGPHTDFGSVWPTNLPGVTVTAGSGYNLESAGVFGVHIQDVSLSTSLGREDLFELGRKTPYYKYANFPVAVDCTININAGGSQPGDMIDADSKVDNLSDEPIIVRLADGTVFDLGTRNKLQNVSYTGGGTDGGIATISYQYQNFNKFSVTSPSDPASLT